MNAISAIRDYDYCRKRRCRGNTHDSIIIIIASFHCLIIMIIIINYVRILCGSYSNKIRSHSECTNNRV